MTAKELPIWPFRQTILDTVFKHPITVIIGETGSGKTTQIAQMLDKAYCAREGCIGVTQPRRVAALTVARRVAEEMRCEVGQEVGYRVRFEERTSRRTRIVYLTDGTLLREMLDDPELSAYSVIVLDEAHERSLNTDVLFGVLKSLVKTRQKPLKLILTSATLDSAKFSAYFDGCPVLNIPGRQYEVQIVHSQGNHENDYLAAAVDTALDIHLHQPPGDILVFLTGQAEIDKAVKQLSEAIAELPEDSCPDLLILPLYAAMPLELQARVFAPPPDGCRRLIMATNIAETSITVDGVVYVVDPGMVKQKSYTPATGMESLHVVPISRVQATQRAGRAGRVCNGKCYRLYTAQFFEREMSETTVPEIQRTNMLTAVLYLKSLPLDIDVLAFDYLDSPGSEALEDALRQLLILDALDRDGHITELGRRMAALPLEPSLARSLLAAADHDCLPETLTAAAMLSAETIFLGNRQGELSEQGRAALAELMKEGLGDHILMLRIFQAWERNSFSSKWCKDMGLDVRGMHFAREVRKQLADLGSCKSQARGGLCLAGVDALRRALLVGFANRLARRMPRHNGYKTLNERATLAQLHPATARIAADEDGLMPEFVIYYALFATAKVFLSKVCPMDSEWVEDILPKLRNIDVERLSGGMTTKKAAKRAAVVGDLSEKQVVKNVPVANARKNDLAAVDAARQRYLARKSDKKK
ncbi:putative ATP-dependent RNA helicase [Coccomyxa subellipsoidea C-169]|uniref:RNA helicase n=1 Tax=Coccomyxa subellipsoidea (strain C-169) TaxID=574566 RepID=I0Z5N4_COCSC|nr:putative ATP-dependent RNA helicase [Coccomyxa subellipsoidea C-169]EIE25953.1 putative ATP-dependent RNA helicase [Coccomyxa subellipsoidea C-169]|eukprot:XP_005650497.1 putative ATP-dependent RNA helicase [Coccomyxa subellipsoidea C-169]